MATQPIDELFAQVKRLLLPYRKYFTVGTSSATTFDLSEVRPGYVTQFAVVVKGARDVRLYFYPLRVFPYLRLILLESQRAHIKSKSILKLTAMTAPERVRLEKLVATAWECIAIMRALDPVRPYGKKWSVDETYAVLAALTRSRRDATLTKRKRFVELELPPKRRPRRLAMLLGPPPPQRWKVDALTPGSYTSIAEALGVAVRKATRK